VVGSAVPSRVRKRHVVPPQPPYARVLEGVLAAIDRGDLKPGDKLPSHTALADEYSVSVSTVQRALNLLKDRGVLIGHSGLGIYVAD
jgi:GntR family transcriptional regulator